jgi:hypothetical protein
MEGMNGGKWGGRRREESICWLGPWRNGWLGYFCFAIAWAFWRVIFCPKKCNKFANEGGNICAKK